MVFAIEPSQDNIDYAQTLARLNNIKNIEWFKEVCSENVGDNWLIRQQTMQII